VSWRWSGSEKKLSNGQAQRSARRVFNSRELITATAGGAASAAIGPGLGRMFQFALGIPKGGSLVVAFPRTLVLLVVKARIKKFGSLALAGVAEAIISLAFGGMFLFPLLPAVVSGLGADIVWLASRSLASQRVRLALCGAALSSLRVLSALVFMIVLGRPLMKAYHAPMWLLWAIIGTNAVLGLLAGLVGASIIKELKKAGVME